MVLEQDVIELDASDTILAIDELVERVLQSGRPLTLRRAGKTVAVLKPAPRRRKRRKNGATSDPVDAIWSIIGIGDSGVPDIAQNKHKYLAEAYLSHVNNTDE